MIDRRYEALLRDLHRRVCPLRSDPRRAAVLDAMEAEAARRNFPIVGPLVGRLLYVLARSIRARRIFEMGSGFGYSAAWFAAAVGPRGRVEGAEGDAANAAAARANLAAMGFARRVRILRGDARRILPRAGGAWDLVYIDAEKEQYPACLRLARRRVRNGGMIVADNVYWFGRTVRPTDRHPTTRGIQRYLDAVFSDPGLATTVVPIRDGVAVSLVLARASRP